jgi:hypothetical protein
MQQPLLPASVWPDYIRVRAAMGCIVSNDRLPFVRYLGFVLHDKLDNSSSFLFEPDPDAVPIRDYLQIGFLH